MIYINKDIYSEKYADMIYEIYTSIKIGIGCELLYVYFGYPFFNHGNVSTFIDTIEVNENIFTPLYFFHFKNNYSSLTLEEIIL